MISSKFWFLILFQVFFQLCSSENIIIPRHNMKVAQLHTNYYLTCHFGPGNIVDWKDSDGNYIDIRFQCKKTGKTSSILFKSVDVDCDYNAKTSTLKIQNITKAQNGTKVICVTDKKEEEFQIKVTDAPQIHVNNLTVVAGMTAMMNCSVTDGNPEGFSFIEWHHVFKKVLLEKRQPSNEDGSLVIPKVTWQDAGTWFCFVTNGKYNSSNYGTLTITGPPILQASGPNVEAISGSSKKLEVYLFPVDESVAITWTHNGQKISKGTPRISSSSWQQEIKGQEVYVSGLTVSLALNNLQEMDGGNYSVSAFTKDGKSVYAFQLKISSKSDMTLLIVGITCGTLVVIIFIILASCIFYCSQRERHHGSIIDAPMSTSRTRIFSIPKTVSLDIPTSDLEMDIYEEIDDWKDHDLMKKEDGYLNPAMLRYAADPIKGKRIM